MASHPRLGRALIACVASAIGVVALAIPALVVGDGRPERSPGLFQAPESQQETPESKVLARPCDALQSRERCLQTLGAAAWLHAGYRGQGVRIALLDTGFRGYRAFLGTALPTHVTCRSFRSDQNLEAKDSQHGILCAEVLHALAPDAELFLANWDVDSSEEFLEAVRWARAEHAHIISCSVISPTWSDGEGGGRFSDRLAALLGDGGASADLLCFASAGNTAQRHWSGLFQPDPEGFHQWQGHQTANALTPWGNEAVSVELYAHSDAHFAIEVRELPTAQAVGRTWHGREPGRSWTITRFNPAPGMSYEARVRLVSGSPGPFHLVALGAGLQFAVPAGSIACPADNADVVAVGALGRDGARAAYSSCGPIHGRWKPDLVAPVPFPSLWRRQPFSGTSAAAPQAAGLAALCWSGHPSWTASQVRDFLLSSACDVAPPGPDCETGRGIVRLPGPAPPAAAASQESVRSAVVGR